VYSFFFLSVLDSISNHIWIPYMMFLFYFVGSPLPWLVPINVQHFVHEGMDSYKIWLGQWRNCHIIFVGMATRFMSRTRYPFMHWFYAQLYIPLLKTNIPWKNSSFFFIRISSFKKIFFEIFDISWKIWFVLKPPTYCGVKFERQINLWCNKWINSSFKVLWNNVYYSC